MGYMRHHAIIVTGWAGMEDLHTLASNIFPTVSSLTGISVNGFRSFLIPPDGSKNGWDESDVGDDRRDRFIAELQDADCNYIEVQYADDDGVSKISREG